MIDKQNKFGKIDWNNKDGYVHVAQQDRAHAS